MTSYDRPLMISLAESYVTQLLVQTSFYGLYIATFGLCLRWLLFVNEGWKLRKPLDWPMLVATMLIFASNTMWLGANARLTMGYVRGAGFNLYFTYAMGVVINVGTDLIILVTDAVMIYRCWKVYNKSWRITILPVLFWHGCLISFILVFYYNSRVIKTLDPTWQTASTNAHKALYPLNAATNIYTTTAIIYRIMRTASTGGGRSLKRLRQLCRNLAEAGFLYTLTTIPPLVTYFLDPTKYLLANQVTTTVNYSMAGIAFNIVLIRVGQNRADTGGSCPDSQATDGKGLLSSGHDHRYPSSSTQDAEKGTSTHGGGRVITYQ